MRVYDDFSDGETDMTAAHLDTPASVYRAVTVRYALSLCVVALLSVLSWFMMSTQLTAHKRQDDTVAIAGAQRMYARVMANFTADAADSNTPAARAHALAELAEAEKHYLAAFETLRARVASPPPSNEAMRALQAMYFEGPDSVVAATTRLEQAVASIEAGRLSKADSQAHADWMRGSLYHVLDQAVAKHRNEGKQTLHDLRSYQVIDLIAVLCVLLFEALFIFAPLARRLAKLTTEMQQQSRILLDTSRELERLASTDGLTRLANRRALDNALTGSAEWIPEQPRSAHARPAGSTGVISFDLDHFKHVNDVHGHPAGDEVLRAVGERLRAVCRSGDLVARMGGDEFTAILYDVPSSEFIEVIAERIRARVAEPVLFEGVQLSVGASIGTCLVPEQASNLKDALRFADDMQREAKQQSKSRRRGGAVAQSKKEAVLF
jgi:diguanylate cyclase (GGDEF)-like protein